MAVQNHLLDALLNRPKINSQDMSKGKQPGKQPTANRTPAFHTHTHTHTRAQGFFDISVTCATSKYSKISERLFFLHDKGNVE
jgi:hypothetical protein